MKRQPRRPPDFHEHLSPAVLASWNEVRDSYRTQYAYHLSIGCGKCYRCVLASDELTSPQGRVDPFHRAMARIQQAPKVDLSLSSRTVDLFVHLRDHRKFRYENVPALLLEESLTSALRSCGKGRVATFLEVPRRLGQLLGADWAAYQARVACEAVRLYLHEHRREHAVKALEAAEGCTDPASRVELLLARFRLACYDQDTENIVWYMSELAERGFRVLFDDPVERFLIADELVRGVSGRDFTEKRDMEWILSQLESGPWRHEMLRINGLYHKARFALRSRHELPDVSGKTADELEAASEGIELYGDNYSQGLYHQLLGELREDPDSLRAALRIFADSGLEEAFLECSRRMGRLTDDPEIHTEIEAMARARLGEECLEMMRMSEESSRSEDCACLSG